MPETNYYYSPEGTKIDLNSSDDTLAIAYRENVQDKDLSKLLRGNEQLIQFNVSSELRRRRLVLYKRSPTARASLENFAQRILRSDLIAYISPVYYLGTNPVVITDEFIAAFKPDVSRQTIEQLNATENVEIIEEYDFAPNTFLLRSRSPGTSGALDTANRYFETGLVDYAEPNMIQIKELKSPFVPDDPLFAQQWHLPRVQAPAAWDITRGAASVIIAIVDDGVDLDHEDFASPGKVVPGRDFVSNDADPRPGAGDDHGTAVAGVATADGHNHIGVTGVAPDCRLMALRLVGVTSVALEAQAFRFAADSGAAIISNSWGPTDGGGAVPLPGIVRAAIDYATNNGRGGRGCVVLFAAGNGNESISSPATLDGYASYNRVIAVAACNDRDVRSGYSDFGPEVNVCAPSDGTSAQPSVWTGFPADGSTRAIFTTDRMGNDGYNPPPSGGTPDPAGAAINYTGTFGGTSSATPLTAGIAALMLSIAPDLTWQQVGYILEATAEKIDATNTDPVGQYQANGHSHWYGYGCVNAFEAVKGARSSVPERDFVHRVTVTLQRRSGDRFVSTKVIQAIDARRRQAETATTVFVRGGPDGFLRAELAPLSDEVEVDS